MDTRTTIAARRATRREQLLHVTQRDSRFGCDLAWAEIRIGKAVLDDVADPLKQPVRMARDDKRIGRRKQRAEEIVDRKLHVGIGRGDRRSLAFVGIPNKVEEQIRLARQTKSDRWKRANERPREAKSMLNVISLVVLIACGRSRSQQQVEEAIDDQCNTAGRAGSTGQFGSH